ncbi:MAG: protein kinase [Planctomycetes bacterium]|nr:protein kinase [Planctomycetota bacterium]
MHEALASPLNHSLGKADGEFLAGLMDAGSADDPTLRDYSPRYQYLDVLGEGGQGKVLRFRDTVLDRDVAVKVVKPPHTKEREKLLENEARLGGMLEHPNILPTYDLCRDETGSPFFVMKKVEGVTLDELLRKAHAEGGVIYSDRDRGELSHRRLLNIFLQVCHSIQYAHSRGVCHLDLKPQNVKLGTFGEVYVLDWGFAARAEDNPKLVAGTPLYIAPERFRSSKPDARCDIYSLGVMLYRILVNQLPRNVGKISFKEFRRRLADFPVVLPRQRDPSLPRDLEAIVMKALRENPDERYQTVGELADDLERFLDILPVSAYREGWYGRTLKFARRHRAAVVAASVMLVAILFTAAAAIRTRRLTAETVAAERRVEEERNRLERANLERILAEEAKRNAEAAQLRAEEERREWLRRRAVARVPLEKGMNIMDKSKTAVDKERDKAKKLQLLQPAIDFFSEALTILEDGGVSRPDAAEAYYARARAYEQAMEINKAATDYRAAYTLDESYIMARYYLGMLYFNHMDRDIPNALAEFNAMNEIDPDNEFSEIGQAYIEAHTGRDAEALARVDRLEAKEREARGGGEQQDSWRNPGLYNIWLIRGRVYGNREGKFFDPFKAIEAYSNFCLYETERPAPYINRGLLRLELRNAALRNGVAAEAEEQLDLALADFTQALAVDPGSKYALQSRGFALFKHKNRLEEGLKDIEAAIFIDPAYAVAILDRAAIREIQGEYDLAEKDYELVKKVQPENTNVDYRLGILYLYTGKLTESEAAFNLAVEKAPDRNSRGVRLHRRGLIRFLRGNYQGAVEDFSQSLVLRTSGRIYPALMRWLALTRTGETPSSEELAKQLDADSDTPWLTVVASIYLGDDPYGEEQAMRLAETPEAICETGFFLGARAWVRGETVSALTFFQHSLDSGMHLFMEYNLAKILSARLSIQKEDSERLPDRVGQPPPPPTAPIPSLPERVE